MIATLERMMGMRKMELPLLGSRPVRAVFAAARNPVEALTTFRERWIERREPRPPLAAYLPDPAWEMHLRSLISLRLPSSAASNFWALWFQTIENLRVRGLRIGPQSFAAWNDGDAALVRAAWYLTSACRPGVVLETGVARGITTRFILEALECNWGGHLWSIDLPPLLYPELHGQVGAAVPEHLKHRWSYVRGSSRRRLPALLKRLGQVDLFIHDSLHSERNLRFELDHVWPVLRPGGFVLVDDIDANSGFADFLLDTAVDTALVCEAEPIAPDLRRVNEKGIFGIIQKPAAC